MRKLEAFGCDSFVGPNFACFDHAEAIVCICEVWRQAAARSATAHLYSMAPSPSARCSSRRDLQIHRIAMGRPAIIVWIVPIQAPLVNVVAQVIKSQAIRRMNTNTMRARLLPTTAI